MIEREQSEAQTRQQWALREALGGAIREQLHHKATREMIIQSVTWGVFIGLMGTLILMIGLLVALKELDIDLSVPVRLVVDAQPR